MACVAETAPSAAVFLRGAADLEEFLTLHLGWLVPPALVYLAREPLARETLDDDGKRRFLPLAAALIAGAYADTIYVGGNHGIFYRFLLPVMPLMNIVLVESARLLGRRRPKLAPAVVPVFAALTLSAVVLPHVPRWSFTQHGQRSYAHIAANLKEINEHYAAVGAWLKDEYPPETVVALNAAGIVPYVSGLRTIDMLGLNDVHIAHRAMDLGQGAEGHEKSDPNYVLERQPDLIVPGLPVTTPYRLGPRNVFGWYSQWFDAFPGDRQLLTDERLIREYAVRSVQLPNGRWFTFFQRKRSKAR